MNLLCYFKLKPQNIMWIGLFLLLMQQAVNAQVSGTVFRDFNANGVKNNTATFNEPFVEGVTVIAYDANGAPVATDTSDVNGAYSFTGLTLPLRIEFSDYQTSDYSAPKGSTNNTSVQFYDAASSSANFGVNYPSDYSQTDPYIATPLFINGSASNSTFGYSIYRWNYSATGGPSSFPVTNTYINPQNTSLAQKSIVGSVYGLAFQADKNVLFAGAFLKRHVGLGVNGLGAIYKVTNATSGSPSVSLFYNIATYPGANVGSIGSDATRGLGAPSNPNHDPTAYGAVGKMGLGDIEISEDKRFLYAVSLADKKLYQIEIDADNNLTTNPNDSDVSSYLIPDPLLGGGQWRPFGLGVDETGVYVGGVYDASLTGNASDLQAVVYRFKNGIFTLVLSFSLNYNKDQSSAQPNCMNINWKAWSDTWPSACSVDVVTNPQPILSDIELHENGTMTLGFIDRFAHQGGWRNYSTNTNSTSIYRTFSSGDILKATKNINGSYTIEPDPGVGEFYVGDEFLNHQEIALGSTLHIAGRTEVLSTVYDAIGVFDNGVRRLSLSDGTSSTNNAYTVFASPDNAGPATFSKASGLGDIELMTAPPPLEIGNRIWDDTDGDGIQDADEAGIDGITVEIYEGSTLVGTTTTANGGQWYFNNSNVNQNGATELKPNTAYTIRVPSAAIPGGQSLTTANVGGAGQPDVRDSDASMVSGNAEIAYTTGDYGQNDHTLDMGFRTPADCSITIDSVTPTPCNSTTNTHNLTLIVSYSNPHTGNILINVGGTIYTFAPVDGTSPDTYTVTGLASDGATGVYVSAAFQDNALCADSDTYNAPISCTVTCPPVNCTPIKITKH